MQKDIKECVLQTVEKLGRIYLEVHYRIYLASLLRKKGYTVYEEYPIIYNIDGVSIGTGRADIICKNDTESYILELKANCNQSNCILSRTINQCERYLANYEDKTAKGLCIFFATNTRTSFKIVVI